MTFWHFFRRRAAASPPPDASRARRAWHALAAIAVLAAGLAASTTHMRAQIVVPPSQTWDNWMGRLFQERPAAADQAIGRFVFPGSHDAATYELLRVPACEGCNNSDLFVDYVASCREKVPAGLHFLCEIPDNVIDTFGLAFGEAQHLTIGEQLAAGARAFDLRFFRATADDVTRSGGVLQEGTYYVHHGLAGPTLDVVLDDLAAFLDNPRHASEVLYLDFRFLMEGADGMSADRLEEFYDLVRGRIGSHIAPAQDEACLTDPTCLPTQRFGADATVAQLLGQGHHVIMSGPGVGADLWPNRGQDPSFETGYPTPDDPQHPWISDQDVVSLIDSLSQGRDNRPSSELFILGVHIGLDDNAMAIRRGFACRLDPENVGGLCPAVNSDWDELDSLRAFADYINPKVLPALVRLRRDRVNVVLADHFTQQFSEEAYKLNAGATMVETRIRTVRELDRHDATSGPDYYPAFRYPGSTPLAWTPRIQRNIQQPNVPEVDGVTRLTPFWPGWKAYPNTDAEARVAFQIFDAEAVGDDTASRINGADAPEGEFQRRSDLPIAGCVQDASQCRDLSTILTTAGSGSDSSRVTYSYEVCVWSWLAGDVVDPLSTCFEPAPRLRVYGVSREEGNAGTTALDFTVMLSAPSASPVTMRYRTDSTINQAPGVDFTPIEAGTLTFAPGETRKVITVRVAGDTAIEGDETFLLHVTPDGGSEILAAGTILNDDDTPTLSVANITVDEGSSGDVMLWDVTLTLDRAVDRLVTVKYATAAGTATEGADFLGNAGTLDFPAGNTTRRFTIGVRSDTIAEADETFFVLLSDANGAFLPAMRPECNCAAIVTIRNDDVAGTLTSPADQAATEGTSTIFSLGTLVDPRAAGPWPILVNWGDGQTSTTTVTTAGALSGAHTYADNGTYTATVTASDASGASAGTGTFSIVVANVAPTATFTGVSAAPEGAARTFALVSPVDPSGADATAGFRYALSCTNGSLADTTYATASTLPSVSCTFDDGPTTTIVRARILDKDGGVTEYATSVTVTNVAPTATFGNGGPVDEGAPVSIAFSGASDPSAADTAAGLRYAFACDGGALDALTWATGSESASTTCTFAQSGTYTVRARIVDRDEGVAEYTTQVIVNDVRPVITAPALQSGQEGAALLLSLGTLADPGADGPWTISVRWGDSTSESFQSAAAGALSRTHTYADNRDYAATVVATDANGVASDPVTVRVRIDNVAPTVTASNAAVVEAGVATIGGTITDPGVHDGFTLSITWGDGTTTEQFLRPGTSTYTATHLYLDDDPSGTPSDVMQVSVLVRDSDEAMGRARALVEVSNVAPVVSTLQLTDETGATIAAPVLALTGMPVSLEAAFTDIGVRDVHAATIAWGDGATSAGLMSGGAGAGVVRGTHAWTAAGNVVVRVQVVDDDGGSAVREVTVTVVDGATAVCATDALIAPIAAGMARGSDEARALARLRTQLLGNANGNAANGACGRLRRGQYTAGVRALMTSVETIASLLGDDEDDEDGDDGDDDDSALGAEQRLALRQLQARLVLAAKWAYQTLAPTAIDARKAADAAVLATQADAFTQAGDQERAIDAWWRAVRLVAPAT